MPVRVELIDEAVEDLTRYARSGSIELFLKKLLRIEEIGQDAGQPLGRGLTGWRKLVVGDRDWRIIFTVDPANVIATVWVIGDRNDDECYREALDRVEAMAGAEPAAASLAAAMLDLMQQRKGNKRRR